MNLKHRVTLALVAVVTLFVATQSVLAYLSLEEQEDDIVDQLVLNEARALALRLAAGDLRGSLGDVGDNPAAWLLYSDGHVFPEPIPTHLASLADGPHRPGRPERHLHAVVMRVPQGRLFVEYDAAQNEAKVHEFGLYLIGLATLCIALGTLLSARVAAWVVGPLERLTARLANWAPADSATSTLNGGDEESRLLDAFNRVQDRFEHAVAHEREFIANISHEIRTPLAALRTDLEMLLTSAQESPSQPRLTRALASVDTITSALEAARAMTQTQRSTAQLIDLAQCVNDAWASVQAPSSAAMLTLHNEIPEGQQIEADRHALLTILRNLMRNALEHASAQHCVARLTERGIEVLDDGIGIAAEELPNIFERYWRGRLRDSAQAQHAETAERGIGLAIARQLADLNGWRLSAQAASSVDARFSQGTCFTLQIVGT